MFQVLQSCVVLCCVACPCLLFRLLEVVALPLAAGLQVPLDCHFPPCNATAGARPWLRHIFQPLLRYSRRFAIHTKPRHLSFLSPVSGKSISLQSLASARLRPATCDQQSAPCHLSATCDSQRPFALRLSPAGFQALEYSKPQIQVQVQVPASAFSRHPPPPTQNRDCCDYLGLLWSPSCHSLLRNPVKSHCIASPPTH